jgi:peptide/nickel transport system permease protein
MKNYLTRRVLSSLLAIIGLFIMVFFLARLTGDPGHLYLPIDAPLEVRKEFSERHGFNDPIYVQFSRFVIDLTNGDFGDSLRKQRPAIDVVLEALPVTLSLAAISMLIALLGAILIGSLAAYKPNGVFDRISRVVSLTAASAPDFWVAITAILIFSVSLRWLPTSGVGGLPYWIMPIGILLIRPLGLLVQVVRGSMITALSSDFVKTARAKGVKEKAVIFKHGLRNGLLPVITVAGDQAAAIANGAVIVETIFGWPGIGKLMIDSILQRDFAVVQASILITAIVILSINIIIDIAYAVLDPRIRHK